jgi:hypothetical protein
MAFRGREGVVKRGYRDIVRLGAWTVDAGALTATASSVDTFQFERGGPFTVALKVGRQEWAWPDTPVSLSDGRLTATLAGTPDRGQ